MWFRKIIFFIIFSLTVPKSINYTWDVTLSTNKNYFYYLTFLDKYVNNELFMTIKPEFTTGIHEPKTWFRLLNFFKNKMTLLS